MVGWLKKHHVECPHCHSLQVSVPWEGGRQPHARRILLLLMFMWLTLVLWVWAAYATNHVGVWILPLVAYAALSLVGMRRIYRAFRVYQCLDCRQSWTL